MIPIVLIHKGNNPYIYNTLYQLKQSNPQAEIYLIGTAESTVYKAFVEHVSIDGLFAEAHEFSKIYKHFSTNSSEFELICIQRWFVLKAFMEQRNIQRCLYLDSDVLVYEDIQQLSEKFTYAGMTICGISGHTNFVDQHVLIDFCKSIFATYTGAEALNKLEKQYTDFLLLHGAGGISDMTLLTAYATLNPGKTENTYYLDGQPTCDPSLEVGAEYFEMDGDSKKITFKKIKPYGILKQTNTPVLFYTLHFQGSNAKKAMLKYIPDKTIWFWIGYIKYRIIYYFQKVQKKLLK